MDDPRRALVDALSGEPSVRLAVLFGSVARGRHHPGSDLDVGVLGPGLDELSGLQVTLSRATGQSVDLVDLGHASPLLRFEIARDGHVLVERADFSWSDFKARAMVDWWDWAPLARLFQSAAAARLRQQVRDGAT